MHHKQFNIHSSFVLECDRRVSSTALGRFHPHHRSSVDGYETFAGYWWWRWCQPRHCALCPCLAVPTLEKVLLEQTMADFCQNTYDKIACIYHRTTTNLEPLLFRAGVEFVIDRSWASIARAWASVKHTLSNSFLRPRASMVACSIWAQLARSLLRATTSIEHYTNKNWFHKIPSTWDILYYCAVM